MPNNETLILIDAGNTLIKVGLIQNDQLIEVRRYTLDQTDDFHKFAKLKGASQFVISSVLSDSDTEKIVDSLENVFVISPKTPTPFTNKYDSPLTLGIDRVCNVSYVKSKIDTEYGVCIDVGTCIKFDIVDREGQYYGGSISPGIDLRYKALNDYTGKLPLLSNKTSLDIVGNDTKTSMRSGVINGVKKEVQGFLESYEEQYESLTFFVTGGDSKYFDLESKNDIFADENLTLLGLYEIFKHNA